MFKLLMSYSGGSGIRGIPSLGGTDALISFSTKTKAGIAQQNAANALRVYLPTKADIGCRTKIVCTIGPSTDTAEQMGELVNQGMSVARLNFSHAGSDYTYANSNFNLLRTALGHHSRLSHQSNQNVPPNLRAVLVDTKGPEVRTGPLPGNVAVLEIPSGATVELHTDPTKVVPDDSIIKLLVDYDKIAKTVVPGGQVLLDDGLVALEVIECHHDTQSVTCIALNGGPIKANKGVNMPGVTLDLPALTDKDKQDLEWAVQVGADYVAASFIRTPDNVRSVVAYLERCIAALPMDPTQKKPLRPLVISKIESKEGVDNFDAILLESDGIMVARGDVSIYTRAHDLCCCKSYPSIGSLSLTIIHVASTLFILFYAVGCRNSVQQGVCRTKNDGHRLQQGGQAGDCGDTNVGFHDAQSAPDSCRSYRRRNRRLGWRRCGHAFGRNGGGQVSH